MPNTDNAHIGLAYSQDFLSPSRP